MTVANQQFPTASILNFLAIDSDAGVNLRAGVGRRLRTIDGLVSVTRGALAEPFDAFGNFAA